VKKLLAELEDARTSHQRRAEIGDHLAEIGDPRPGVGVKDDVPDITWVSVPAGEITLEGNAGTFKAEPFHLARYPVTYQQFLAFYEAKDGFTVSSNVKLTHR
jgi:formylglycine-generating enzyme required for sulfatase activity